MTKKFNHKFVDIIPDKIYPDVLYISVKYNTAIHLCPCGCGKEIATPLSPYDWKIIFDGESISLYPSIGNWSLPCQSHYWITNNIVEWAPKWNKEKIKYNRTKSRRNKQNYYSKKKYNNIFNSLFK